MQRTPVQKQGQADFRVAVLGEQRFSAGEELKRLGEPATHLKHERPLLKVDSRVFGNHVRLSGIKPGKSIVGVPLGRRRIRQGDQQTADDSARLTSAAVTTTFIPFEQFEPALQLRYGFDQSTRVDRLPANAVQPPSFGEHNGIRLTAHLVILIQATRKPPA